MKKIKFSMILFMFLSIINMACDNTDYDPKHDDNKQEHDNDHDDDDDDHDDDKNDHDDKDDNDRLFFYQS